MAASSSWAGRLAIALLLVVYAPPADADPPGGGDLERLTSAFAAFEGRDLEGRLWTAADLRGRVVVIDFWAHWCAPCLAEIPWLRAARERFGEDRVVILGVSLDVTARRTLIGWLQRQRVTWPQVWDNRGYEGTLAHRFGVESLPAIVLIDRDGRAAAAGLRGQRMLDAIEALLARPAGPQPGSPTAR